MKLGSTARRTDQDGGDQADADMGLVMVEAGDDYIEQKSDEGSKD